VTRPDRYDRYDRHALDCPTCTTGSTGTVSRIFLSPPDVGPAERELLLDAFDSGWIAPVGAHLDAFEREIAGWAGVPHAAALSSGTAALHLALILLGVRRDDEVLVPTLTFVATANAVAYVGATPTFLDADATSWCLDPALLADELDDRARRGRLPKAVITVDLYGQCADYTAITSICAAHGVPIIEDAAEALGASCGGQPAGSFGELAAFSFNGNKIITTSGGGMLVSRDRAHTDRARHLATQARDDQPYYEHSVVGYNYRLSNLLAAVGLGQMRSLRQRVERRRHNYRFYRQALGGDGLSLMPMADYGRSNCWLTCLLVDVEEFGATPVQICDHLRTTGIEAQPTWKPMHLQPVFQGYPMRGGTVSAGLFGSGLCLPSGSALTDHDRQRVVGAIRSLAR